MSELLFALWFFLPAGIANAAPVLVNNVPYLTRFNTPIDGGKSFRSKRILGDNKTFRGLIAGVAAGGLIGIIQFILASNVSFFNSLTDYFAYDQPLAIMLGFVLGFGALLGDAVESFFKRQLSISSGASWVPFDQIDFIVGGILLSATIVRLPATTYLLILLVWTCLHPIANIVGWALHLKPRKF